MEDIVQYSISTDADGKQLDGSGSYKLHLSPNIRASNFWSVTVYNSQTGSIIQTDQPWPSVHMKRSNLLINHDGSVDSWFGPKAPVGNESNWVKTIPGKDWFLILRLYGSSELHDEESWKPGKVEEINQIIAEKEST